jgi:DNA-binding HxlR family transcriptional regulator
VPGTRSSCPINACVEIFGDRWSLLVIRDLMLRGYRTYKELMSAAEGIATNILADRLAKLEDAGILASMPDPRDGRKQLYRLTEKGVDLAPIVMEMARWAVTHDGARGSPALVELVRTNKLASEVRRRWEHPELEPLLPPARKG